MTPLDFTVTYPDWFPYLIAILFGAQFIFILFFKAIHRNWPVEITVVNLKMPDGHEYKNIIQRDSDNKIQLDSHLFGLWIKWVSVPETWITPVRSFNLNSKDAIKDFEKWYEENVL